LSDESIHCNRAVSKGALEVGLVIDLPVPEIPDRQLDETPTVLQVPWRDNFMALLFVSHHLVPIKHCPARNAQLL